VKEACGKVPTRESTSAPGMGTRSSLRRKVSLFWPGHTRFGIARVLGAARPWRFDHTFGPVGEARTVYCHLSRTAVAEGTTVKRGDVIGYIGTTGYTSSSGALAHCMHVHFEVRRVSALMSVHIGRGNDPMPFLVGCFDPEETYATDRLVLTWPVKC
jgi:hypothetical protein